MNVLPVMIERFVNDDFPSCVECVLVDSEECSDRFVEKAPVVTTANLLLDSAFPQPGHIACVVEDEWIDERGRQLVRVSTTNPWVLNQQPGIRPSPSCANKLSLGDAVRFGSVPAFRAIGDFQLDAGWALRR